MNLKESFKKLNIKGALFDLEDTLINTNIAFKTHIDNFISTCSKETNINKDELRRSFEEIHIAAMPVVSVKISRWHYVLKKMGEKYGVEARKVFINNYFLLSKIYTHYIPPKPGSLEVLKKLNKNNIKISIVTHANKDWTDYKIDNLGIRKYFDHIEIADETKPKGKESWKNALNALKLNPKEVFLVGDNVKGDIIAGKKIGIKRTFLLPSPFKHYTKGEVPNDTRQINEIKELLDAIIKS